MLRGHKEQAKELLQLEAQAKQMEKKLEEGRMAANEARILICGLCYEREADAIFKCGHIYACMTCCAIGQAQLAGDHALLPCPVCRGKSDFTQVFNQAEIVPRSELEPEPEPGPE